jgi:hypothetical protein
MRLTAKEPKNVAMPARWINQTHCELFIPLASFGLPIAPESGKSTCDAIATDENAGSG